MAVHPSVECVYRVVSQPHVSPSLPTLLLSNNLQAAFGWGRDVVWDVLCEAQCGQARGHAGLGSVNRGPWSWLPACTTALALTGHGLVGSTLCTCWDFPCVVVSPRVTQPLGPWVLAPEAQMQLAVGLRKAFPPAVPTRVPRCPCPPLCV